MGLTYSCTIYLVAPHACAFMRTWNACIAILSASSNLRVLFSMVYLTDFDLQSFDFSTGAQTPQGRELYQLLEPYVRVHPGPHLFSTGVSRMYRGGCEQQLLVMTCEALDFISSAGHGDLLPRVLLSDIKVIYISPVGCDVGVGTISGLDALFICSARSCFVRLLQSM